ncbi:MAG: RDD family protein [Dehalococcoidia bacterium]|nr:RDD family protein [Dehalococcoidia bacterium]
MLNERHTVVTPENVELRHEVAGVGSRITAAAIDYSILLVSQTLLYTGAVFLLSFLQWNGLIDLNEVFGTGSAQALRSWVIGIVLVLIFFGWWGYYVLFELLWNGQTPGKRMLGLRVMGRQAQRVGGFASVVRNMIRPVDQFLLIGLLVMFIDGQSRRLGDFAVGTLVIRDPRMPKGGLPDALAVPAPPAALEALQNTGFSPTRMTQADYALLREFFERRKRIREKQAEALAGQVAQAFAARLDAPIPPAITASQYLAALAAAYEARHQYGDVGRCRRCGMPAPRDRISARGWFDQLAANGNARTLSSPATEVGGQRVRNSVR